MAYFQMDKNPIRKLETNDDYSLWAKECFKHAQSYYNIVMRCLDMLLSENMDAVYTNVAFACELYLKCLLFENRIDCRREHDLYDLYKKLPVDIQNSIKDMHPCTNTKKEYFETELKEVGKAFIVFRYMYERTSMAWNGLFLIELLTLFHNNIVDD